MDINKHTNRQHKTTDISPYLRKAQVPPLSIHLKMGIYSSTNTLDVAVNLTAK